MIAKADCKQGEKRVAPLVNLSGCEGKGDCVEVCPYDVFEIRGLTGEERKTLSIVGHIKTIVHGTKKAFITNPELCMACGLCVRACPERAIKLVALL